MNKLEKRIQKMTNDEIELALTLLAKIPLTVKKDRDERLMVWHALCTEQHKRLGDDEFDAIHDLLDEIRMNGSIRMNAMSDINPFETANKILKEGL